MTDRTGWAMNQGLPRGSGLLEPFADFHVSAMGVYGGHGPVADAVSTPAFKEMIKTLWEISDMQKDLNPRMHQLDVDVEAHGYPVLCTGFASVPFDSYSDFLRGTLDGLSDLYDRPEEVMAFCEESLAGMLEMIKMQGQIMPGKHVFMALHKGMDGFMSSEHYRTFYWNHLQIIINAIIDAGMVPYIYTEGKYNSRLDCLAEVPVGKVFYHFEQVDMALAKSKLGKVACIGGGFSPYLLNYGTKQEVIDECKRLLDVCAPGGGFIFQTKASLDGGAKRENVEAMFRTVRDYGKY
jgi:uroporphyrinogen-III decarboxylase